MVGLVLVILGTNQKYVLDCDENLFANFSQRPGINAEKT